MRRRRGLLPFAISVAWWTIIRIVYLVSRSIQGWDRYHFEEKNPTTSKMHLPLCGTAAHCNAGASYPRFGRGRHEELRNCSEAGKDGCSNKLVHTYVQTIRFLFFFRFGHLLSLVLVTSVQKGKKAILAGCQLC
ncbi:hypothetical protein EDC01DRAFT_246792 [Geopyxis carbonaria]|nr:hypothetical protein EDC01DRAFT_246792 [Geopyxis carbonaria]